MLVNDQLDNLKVFTLNCWGLRYVSQHRKQRIKLIAQHLAEQDYDIVFLQEVWIQSDFDLIRTKTKSKYTFAHIFNNASILGTSGLVIMAKWIPKIIHFHPYSINGSPFRPNHGDWFSTKGVAYARIELKGSNLHLFCTHMHAQYDENEDITDQYSIHRICQSYELAKYINLMACSCAGPASKDLIIMAGDLNTSSKELPYRLLVEMTGLADCYKYNRKKKSLRKANSTSTLNSSSNDEVRKPFPLHLARLKSACSDESSDEDLITCGHKDNTFTKPTSITPKTSKRIDFILYKLRDLCKMNDCGSEIGNHCESDSFTTTTFMSCIPEQIKINAKDVSGLSYSDHQPVAAKLNFLYYVKTYDESRAGNHVISSTNVGSDGFVSSKIKAKNKQTKDLTGELLQQHSSSSSSSSSSKPLQLKQIANNMLSHNHTHTHQLPSNQSTVGYSKLNNSNSSSSSSSSSSLLHDIEDLLADYINSATVWKYLLTVGFALFVVSVLLIVIYFSLPLTSIEMLLLTIILLLVCMFVLFLQFFTHRHEMNAIKAILNDIRNKKSFSSDYGLLESE